MGYYSHWWTSFIPLISGNVAWDIGYQFHVPSRYLMCFRSLKNSLVRKAMVGHLMLQSQYLELVDNILL